MWGLYEEKMQDEFVRDTIMQIDLLQTYLARTLGLHVMKFPM